MALYRTEGIVLKTRDLGEADRIVTLYSPDRGKIRAVARGARRPRSRFVSSTQMFSHADFLLFSGKSLDNISQVELKASFPRLHEDLTRLAYASYAVELVDEMVEEGGRGDEVFALLLAFLRVVSDTRDAELACRAFEVKLATALGYAPRLDSCSRCGAALTGQDVGFDAEAGGAVCGRCLAAGPAALRVSLAAVGLLRAFGGLALPNVERVVANERLRRESAAVMRSHLDFRLDRKLRSLDFIAAVAAAPGDAQGAR